MTTPSDRPPLGTTTGPAVAVTGITVGPLQENCWLLVDRSAAPDGERAPAVLVDPGDEPARLIALLDAEHAALTAIWLTHGHVDHVGAVGPLVSEFGVPVYMHPADRPLYERAEVSGRLYGMHFEQPPAPDRELAEGDVVHCGTVPFDVIHLPGHSPGHVAFLRDGVCLSGDVLFAGSIGRTDLPLSDPRAMHQSLQRVAALPSSLVVLPGHGGTTTIAREVAANPFLRGVARPVGA